jgi:transketolase
VSREVASTGGVELFDCRDAFAKALDAVAAADERIVVVCNDSIGSSKLGAFKTRFPQRLVNVGIAEQNMIGVAAGLANGGRLPFVCGASCFLTGRALEQIKADVAYSDANVKLVGMSSGMAYGELGPTHHSIEDFAWLRAIARMRIVAPADPVETDQVIRFAATDTGPMFIRLSRMGVPRVHGSDYAFRLGKAALLRPGRDVTIMANGTLVSRALDAATQLASDGIDARVLNMATVRPLDVDAVVAAARETGAIVTAEEHTIHGGLGGAVAEAVVTRHPVPMRIIGVPGTFAPTGSAEFLHEHFGLTGEAIARAARELVAERRRAA